MFGKTLDIIKQAAIRVARRTPDSVTIQEIYDDCTTAHDGLHRNRGVSPWHLLLGKTLSGKTICENPDLAQCSVEVVDEAVKERLRVKEESYKAYIEEELSFRKRRQKFTKVDVGGIGQQANGAWRSGKHEGSKMKGEVFLGPTRVQDRETTAESVRMEGVVWITEGTSLVLCAVQHLRSKSQTQKPCFQDLVKRLPRSTFLHPTTYTDAPDDAWREDVTVWTHEADDIQAAEASFGNNNLMQHHVKDLTWFHQVNLCELMMKCQYKNQMRHVLPFHILRQVNRLHPTFLLTLLNLKTHHRQCPLVVHEQTPSKSIGPR